MVLIILLILIYQENQQKYLQYAHAVWTTDVKAAWKAKLIANNDLKYIMSKPTLEELQTELQDVVKKHNQAQEVVKQCQTRFTELTAIIKDRTTPESDAT